MPLVRSKQECLVDLRCLFPKNDQDELAKRGFDQEYTPVRLTKEFLENIVQMAEAKCGESEIDNLVIGAPEVWFQEMNTVSGRGTLRDICQQLPNMRPEGESRLSVNLPVQVLFFCV